MFQYYQILENNLQNESNKRMRAYAFCIHLQFLRFTCSLSVRARYLSTFSLKLAARIASTPVIAVCSVFLFMSSIYK